MKNLSVDRTNDVKELLELYYRKYNATFFIETDPISIPHRFTLKEDREIAGFLAATLAWGQRVTILKNTSRLLAWMDDSPYDFICHHTAASLKPFRKFVHRTFNGEDAIAFIKCLKHVYLKQGGLENVFAPHPEDVPDGGQHISRARKLFFEIPHPLRSEKHFADPNRGSAAKRINMFLRWMVRKDSRGIDFGIWSHFTPRELICPVDVHSGRVARSLGLLHRKQDDWKAAVELTKALRVIDATDPVRFDFALFGLGVFEQF
jgi:uncharacterized protein (TIGR02757 family)